MGDVGAAHRIPRKAEAREIDGVERREAGNPGMEAAGGAELKSSARSNVTAPPTEIVPLLPSGAATVPQPEIVLP
jgi:hypothetical protein